MDFNSKIQNSEEDFTVVLPEMGNRKNPFETNKKGMPCIPFVLVFIKILFFSLQHLARNLLVADLEFIDKH